MVVTVFVIQKPCVTTILCKGIKRVEAKKTYSIMSFTNKSQIRLTPQIPNVGKL